MTDNKNDIQSIINNYNSSSKKLKERFEQYKSGRRLRVVVKSILAAFISAAALLIVFLLVERTPIQSETLRRIFAGVLYGGVICWLHRLYGKWFNGPSDVALAVEIENGSKRFNSGLSSAVEFMSSPEEEKSIFKSTHSNDNDLSNVKHLLLDDLKPETKYTGRIVTTLNSNDNIFVPQSQFKIETKLNNTDSEEDENDENKEQDKTEEPSQVEFEEYVELFGTTVQVETPSNISIISDETYDTNIEGIIARTSDNGRVIFEGLVPNKTYDEISTTIKYVDDDNSKKDLELKVKNVKTTAVEEVQEFLSHVYSTAFLRYPDETGYVYWIKRLKEHSISARDFLINLMFAENEFSDMKYNDEQFITVLYSIIVNREPDKEGLEFWINAYVEVLGHFNFDVYNAKKYIVDRMINEDEFKRLAVRLGLLY